MLKTYKELSFEGINDKQIKKLILEKKLFKIDKGLYSDNENVTTYELISKKYSNAIVTLESAFYLYGIAEEISDLILLATSHKSKVLKNDKIKQSFISDDIFELGKTEIKFNDNIINIYDKEKLLIEIIRNKNKYSSEYFNKVINYYKLNEKEIDKNKLYSYLKKYKYIEKVEEFIEKNIFNNIKRREVNMKGIVLAGGSGTRLAPITEGTSKQLLPIYNKPMIYYPISVLMLAGIRNILIITTEEDQPSFKRLLKDGSQFGVNFEYVIQPSPNGLAEAFILGEEFIGDECCAMVLGDNIFYGNGFVEMLNNAVINAEKGYATNFGIEVPDPERFGIMEVDKTDDGFKIKSVEEKPEFPKSNYAITGLYFYPKGVSEKAKTLKPSKRNELEITSLNEVYLNENRLMGEILGGGFNWYDTGTFESLYDAISSIRNYEKNRGRIIACLEQIAYDNGWINHNELEERAKVLSKNSYGDYLKSVLKNRK